MTTRQSLSLTLSITAMFVALAACESNPFKQDATKTETKPEVKAETKSDNKSEPASNEPVKITESAPPNQTVPVITAEQAAVMAEPLNAKLPTVTVNGSLGSQARGEGYSISLFTLDYDPRAKTVYYDVKLAGPAGKAKRLQISEVRNGLKQPIQLMLDGAPAFSGGGYNKRTPSYSARSTEFNWLNSNGVTRTTFQIEIEEAGRVVRLVQPMQYSPEVKKIIFQSAS
jgi:hypothetical protein